MKTVSAVIVYAASAVIMILSIVFCVVNYGSELVIDLSEWHWLQYAAFALDALIAAFILYKAIRNKSILLLLLSLSQIGLLTWFEFFGRQTETEWTLYVDHLSLIMILIIGIVGPLICVYSVGYLRDYHAHHTEIKDRRGYFMAVELIFLVAMFGLVIANDMTLMLLCWEATTLASFLLIGYTGTPDAVKNSMLALKINVLGGLLFTVALVVFDRNGATDFLTLSGISDTPIVQVAVLLMGVAALTKSAQFPFSKWLLGAMVAPTPSSALLHSSTMVKAGVYLVLRLAPHLGGEVAGITITLIGGITFFVGALMTVSQSDGKRMLAYSTISNLGLIVACAGINTAESLWAAAMLIIFHAVTKALLFLAVGTTEHQIGSRDLEAMDGLAFISKPLGIVLIIGIAGMFVAPFGMLISKWAAMKAFLDSGNILLMILIAFGSAVIFFSWTKWMGKLIANVHHRPAAPHKIHADEQTSLYGLAGLVVLICLLHPLVSRAFVMEFIQYDLGLSLANPIAMTISTVIICILVLLFVFPVVLIPLFKNKGAKTSIYLAGENVGGEAAYHGALGQVREVELKNFYMKDIFGETFWVGKTIWVGIAVLVLGALVIAGGAIL